MDSSIDASAEIIGAEVGRDANRGGGRPKRAAAVPTGHPFLSR